jgi:type II secretory pathway component PulF
MLVADHLRDAIDDVRSQVRAGQPVGEALERHPEVFPRSIVGTIKAGERGSRMDEACQTVADALESDARLRSELLSSLTYPALIVLVGLASIVVMGAIVVPRFAEIFAGFGAELPPATRALLAISDVIRRFGLLIAAGTAAVAGSVLACVRGERARLRVDALLLRLPVVGALRLGFSSARVCRALGGMLSTGMPLLFALDAAGDAAGDLEIGRRLMSAREAVAGGRRLSDALAEDRVLTPVALQLVGVGENGGKLGPMLIRAGDLVAERTQMALRAALSLAEPILIIALGGMVAGVAGALLQAVYSVRP